MLANFQIKSPHYNGKGGGLGGGVRGEETMLYLQFLLPPTTPCLQCKPIDQFYRNRTLVLRRTSKCCKTQKFRFALEQSTK